MYDTARREQLFRNNRDVQELNVRRKEVGLDIDLSKPKEMESAGIPAVNLKGGCRTMLVWRI